MKLLLITLAFIAAVAADVSHLNNQYLPPVGESSVPQDEQVPEPSASLTIDLPEPLVNPQPIKDAVVQHVAFAARYGQQAPAAPEVPEVVAEQEEQPEESVAEAEPEQAVEQAPEVESEAEVASVEQFSPAAEANSEYDIPALPEVSNGIDTRYGSNGGYIY